MFGEVHVCNSQETSVEYHYKRKEVDMWYKQTLDSGECKIIDQAGDDSWVILRWNNRSYFSNQLSGTKKFTFEDDD